MNRHRLGGSDEESRDHRPEDAAEAAEEGDDQTLEERQVADVRLRVEDLGEQDGREAGEGAGNDEDGESGLRAADPDEGGALRVLRQRADARDRFSSS